MNYVFIVEGTGQVEAPAEAGVPEGIILVPLRAPCHLLVPAPVLVLVLDPAHQGEFNFPPHIPLPNT